jgi:hypothetical protein
MVEEDRGPFRIPFARELMEGGNPETARRRVSSSLYPCESLWSLGINPSLGNGSFVPIAPSSSGMEAASHFPLLHFRYEDSRVALRLAFHPLATSPGNPEPKPILGHGAHRWCLVR